MVDITSISHRASSSLMYDIHHIVRLILCLIEEDHHIATHDEESSMPHGPSIRTHMPSTTVRMQLIRGRGRGRGGGRGCGRAGERVVVDWMVMLLVIPLMRLPYHTSIPHHPPILSYHPRIPYHP